MTFAVQYMGGNVFLAFYLTAGMVSSLGSYAGGAVALPHTA